MRNKHFKNVVATTERNWKDMVTNLWNMSICPAADSWYQGANVPGKAREPLTFTHLPRYVSVLEDSAKNNYNEFVLS